MGLLAKKPEGGENHDPVSQGVHVGLCIGIFDLGSQYSEFYGKISHKVLVMWEIPEERIDIEKDGKTFNLPRAISKTYTLSLHEKAALRKDVESWRGRSFTEEELEGFDIFTVLGHGCQIQVIHKKVDDKTYANIAAIMSLPKGHKASKPENELRQYSIADDGLNIPESTPDWIKDIIKKSEEYRGMGFDDAVNAAGAADHEIPEDDIPF